MTAPTERRPPAALTAPDDATAPDVSPSPADRTAPDDIPVAADPADPDGRPVPHDLTAPADRTTPDDIPVAADPADPDGRPVPHDLTAPADRTTPDDIPVAAAPADPDGRPVPHDLTAPTDRTVPENLTAPADRTVPENLTVPADQPATADRPTSTHQPVPADQSAPVDQPVPVDLLVLGGDVLTVDDAGTLIREGAVAVRGGEIVDVGPVGVLRARYRAADTLDATGCLVMPGLLNTHTHLAMTLLRGRADDVTLQGFLERVIRWEGELLSPRNVAAAVRVAVAESVRAGVTSALDMYWFHESAELAAREAGWRLHTGPTFMDVPEPADGIAFEDRLAWARDDLAARPARPGHRPVVFAHSAYTLSPAQLTEIAALAGEFGALLHIHASENAAEVATVVAAHGKRPVELLDALGLLGPDLLLAHAVDLTEPEIAALARTGASVAHCPVSNLKLGCGIAPVPRLLDAGVTVGLGTDGAVSSNTLDLLGALRQAALLHKAGGDPTAVGAERAVRMATIDGARALGLDAHLGSLEPGKRADLIVLDLDRPHLTPRHDEWSMLAYAAQASDVRDTVVDGRVLMRDRVLTTLDEAETLRALRALSDLGTPARPERRPDAERRDTTAQGDVTGRHRADDNHPPLAEGTPR